MARYYTENNKEITNRVLQGKTTIFLHSQMGVIKKQEAVEYAKNKRSYVYDVYTDSKDNGRIVIGQAVPR